MWRVQITFHRKLPSRCFCSCWIFVLSDHVYLFPKISIWGAGLWTRDDALWTIFSSSFSFTLFGFRFTVFSSPVEVSILQELEQFRMFYFWIQIMMRQKEKTCSVCTNKSINSCRSIEPSENKSINIQITNIISRQYLQWMRIGEFNIWIWFENRRTMRWTTESWANHSPG